MGWTRGPTVGRGSTATVSLATSDSTGVLAVKSIALPQSHHLQRETNILSSISSPAVVTYIGCGISMEHNQLFYNIFMEYIPGGNLSDRIRAHGGLPESAIGAYTRHILLGLEYLHSVGIAHCDIKASNILMSPSGPKIADLGCARRVNDSAVAITGTPLFMAPEVARGEEQGCPADLWSLGCTVIEMATGKSPWAAGNYGDINGPLSLMYRIAYSDEAVPEFPGWLSEEARDFLSKCLIRDPKERWTARRLLDHCFINKFTSRDYVSQERYLRNHHSRDVKEKKNHCCCSNYYSPMSILDQGIWCGGDGEAEEQQMDEERSWIKPAKERIRELSESNGLADWGFGDNWIVVRG